MAHQFDVTFETTLQWLHIAAALKNSVDFSRFWGIRISGDESINPE
jgi:hypothetical protein